MEKKVTLYYGEDVIFISVFPFNLLMDFPVPVAITGLKIEEIEKEETPQNPEYRFNHLSEEPIG